jgi:hypothetical protein
MEEANNISKKNFNSQRIRELLKSITEEDRMKFFRSWSNLRSENECIAFDITSISSYSKLIECVERLRIHSDKAMDGRIFIAFISLIMQSHIHKVMKENKRKSTL